MSTDIQTATSPTPLYARFSRRMRGIVIDWIIAMVVLFGAVMLASASGSSAVSRTLGYLVVAFLLLYEPLLVTVTGGTVGHWASNLRVVDDRTGGNVSFAKALARLVIKGVLSWYSFVILAATRRNQAVHDLLTRSTVQIRDAAKARPGQYVTERAEPPVGSMPSRLRRFLVTMLYIALSFAFCAAIGAALTVGGAYSERCVAADFCSGRERMIDLAISVGALLLTAGVIALGWNGRLPGARRA
ncbi:MAG: RDD family protein [Bradyrhizobium sp.]|nr:RDD family protein [Bradyrhizobium sp.]